MIATARGATDAVLLPVGPVGSSGLVVLSIGLRRSWSSLEGIWVCGWRVSPPVASSVCRWCCPSSGSPRHSALSDR